MTYFGFLIIFLVFPILLLGGLLLRLRRSGRKLLDGPARPALLAIPLMVLIALAYTTPWDNYLVATGVWWYDPALVTGIIFGWVPIEEYTFFVLQPILGGIWLLLLIHLLPQPASSDPLNSRLRILATAATGLLWGGALLLLLTDRQAGTYLALELVWALPAIALQLAFGADVLWRYRRLVLYSIVPLTLYLSAADSLAISSGTWTIDPEQSLDLLLGGILPLEEFVFFLLTNTLVSFGIILIWAEESRARLQHYLSKRPGSKNDSSFLRRQESKCLDARRTHSQGQALRGHDIL
jgi:lycopene cyclase domain-containing protein